MISASMISRWQAARPGARFWQGSAAAFIASTTPLETKASNTSVTKGVRNVWKDQGRRSAGRAAITGAGAATATLPGSYASSRTAIEQRDLVDQRRHDADRQDYRFGNGQNSRPRARRATGVDGADRRGRRGRR